MQSRICAVFDLDDTVFLERHYVRSGFEAVGKWAERWLRLPDFGERCWHAFNEGARGNIFNQALRESGRDQDDSLVAALVAIYRTHAPTIKLLPDARDTLQALRDFCPVAVITDGPVTSQSRKAEALGIDSIASPIILTEAMGSAYRKPHRRAFEQIVLDLPARTYVYVADNPLKDFQAPQVLGWRTIRIRRPGGLHFGTDNSAVIPDHELSDCSSVFDILKHL